MPVTTILLLRHGHRLTWTLDHRTGKYSSTHPFPTGLPADPPLASHGARQAEETAVHLASELGSIAAEDRLRVYSSAFYRCPETLKPTVQRLGLRVRCERGIGEWFGKAPFRQPEPAPAAELQARHFSWVEAGYRSLVEPAAQGELMAELHDRVARALELVIADVEAEFARCGRGAARVTLLMCGHAAPIIAAGRVLTGRVPADANAQDFRCFTCGISKFVRRGARAGQGPGDGQGPAGSWRGWRTNGGVAGGWDCVLNSWCGHLSHGEERGWHFHGDETFDSYGSGTRVLTDAGSQKTVTSTDDGGPKL